MQGTVCRLMLEIMKRSGMRPSSCICEGRKFRFHCCRTMRVLGKPESTIAEPTARTPAGAMNMSAPINGSIRVR